MNVRAIDRASNRRPQRAASNAGAAAKPYAGAVAPPAGHIETAIAILVFITYSCGIVRLLFNDDSGTGAAAFRAATTAGYLATVLFLVPQRHEVWRLVRQSPQLSLLCVLPLVSTLWSTSPNDTLTRSVTLLGSSAFGFYLAVRFRDRQLLRFLCVSASLIAVLSIVLIAAVPALGVHSDAPWTGTWRGAYLHKNALGPAMGLNAALLALYCLERPLQTNRWAPIGLFLCCALVVAAKSVTGLIVLMTGVIVLVIVRVFGRRIKTAFAPTLLMLLPVALAVVFFVLDSGLVELTGGLGRDVSFSGRVPIWTALWPLIEKNFWFGYGYEAFWVKSQIGVRVIEDTLHFRPFYAHNGIVELFLSLGMTGVALFCALFLTFLWRLVRCIAQSPDSTLGNTAALFTLSFVMVNFSEVLILARNEALWCLFIALYLKLAAPVATLVARPTTQTRHRPGTSGRW